MTLPDPNLDPEQGTPVAQRVYAPASERVPVDPVAGHRDFIEHADASTPERIAAARPPEPSFTRVERPRMGGQQMSYSSRAANPTLIGSLVLVACGGLGAWLYMRWQRERNKPINRLRRQALQAATELRGRVPSSDELRQPGGMGVLATLVSLGLVMWGARQSRRPTREVHDADWQQRLVALKERWTPRRVEMEKFSISRH